MTPVETGSFQRDKPEIREAAATDRIRPIVDRYPEIDAPPFGAVFNELSLQNDTREHTRKALLESRWNMEQVEYLEVLYSL